MADAGRLISDRPRHDVDVDFQRILPDISRSECVLGFGTMPRVLYQWVHLCTTSARLLLTNLATGVLGTWFKVRFPLMIGVTVCGSSIGGVVFPIMMDRIVQSLGFPWAIRIAAFLNMGLLIIVNFTVKARIQPKPQPVRLREFIQPFTSLSFSLSVAGACLVYLAIFLPYNYVIVQAREAGVPAEIVSYLVPIMNATRQAHPPF